MEAFKINKPILIQLSLAIVAGLLLGIASVILPPRWLLAGLAGAMLCVAVIGFKKPEIALLGYLIILSTILDESRLPRIPIGIGRLLLTDIILLASFALILMRLLAERDFKIVRTPLDLPVLGFVGIAMFSTMFGIFQSSLTINESLGEARVVISYLTFFIVTNLVREKQQVHTLVNGIFLLGSIVALAMVAQFVLGNSLQILPGRVEILGTEGTAFLGVTRIIPPGESLIFVTFITITVTLVLERSRLTNWFTIPIWGLTGIGVILTFKRNLWVAVFIILLALAVLGWKEVWPKMSRGVLVFMIIGVCILIITLNSPESAATKLVSGALERLTSLTDPQTFEDPDSSLRWRDFEYQYAIPQIISHPLLGLGMGAMYRPFVSGKDSNNYDGRKFIHNGHVYIMIKAGLLGYLAFISFSLVSLLRGLMFWRQVSDRQFQAILLGFTLAYLGILIGSFVSPMIMTAWWTPVIGIMLGTNEVILKQIRSKDS
jgi:O-antigen ligase